MATLQCVVAHSSQSVDSTGTTADLIDCAILCQRFLAVRLESVLNRDLSYCVVNTTLLLSRVF